MKKVLGLLSLAGFTLAATSMVAFSSYAQQAQTKLREPMDMGVDYEEIAFEAADTDGDNLISEGEFARDAAEKFKHLPRLQQCISSNHRILPALLRRGRSCRL